jgi:DNA repair protein RadC
METTPSVPAAGCRWITSERCRDPSTSELPNQLPLLSPFPDAVTGFEEPPYDPRRELNASRNRIRNSSVKRITAADIAHFDGHVDPRPQLRSRTGAFIPPLYIRRSCGGGQDAICPADANTIVESAEALLAYRLRRGVKILRDPWLLLRFIQIRLVSQPCPVFAVFFLDRNQRLIHFAELFHGEESKVKVCPKEVVRETLAWNAERLLCVRSDPAGDHQPTSDDLVAAGRVKRALDLLNVPLLDYVIVGESLTSLRLRGVI